MPEAKIVKMDFSEIKIEHSEIYKLLGYPENSIPDGIVDTLAHILEEAKAHLNILGGYVICDILKLDAKNGILQIENALFSPGRTICINLKGSEKAIFFLCSAGEGITRWTSGTMESDPVKAYMIDILGSLVVDSAADILESQLESIEGLNITNRYSPGYCGWKLTEQKMLFDLFPGNFCNIKLTESSLMIPIKSVSGVIGSGKSTKKRAYACEICDSPNCFYRNLRNPKI
jgi:hypothetical protein